MFKFSKRSEANLMQCDERLQKVFRVVIKYFDCTIICGHRIKEIQNKLYINHLSKLKWPHGKHNKKPSAAVDVSPYPIIWTDRERFYYFAGFVIGIAASMEITLRYGGDWDSDHILHDQNFYDLVHFEIVE